MEKKLWIQMLGGFSIYYGKKAVALDELDNAGSVRLLQMLVLSMPEGISSAKLLTGLYGLRGRAQEEYSGNLKELFGRLNEWLLACGMPQGAYAEQSGEMCCFHCEIPVELDARAFEQTARQAQQTGDETERFRLLLAAAELYRGDLLPAISSEAWFYRRRAELKQLYLDTIRLLEEEYKKRGDTEGRLHLYERVAAVYPYESWQARQIRCLLELNRYDEALTVYHTTLEMYAAGETGARATEELRACFDQMELLDKAYRETAEREGRRALDKKLLQSGKELKKAIFDGKAARGPYSCSFSNFEEHYRLAVRIKQQHEVPSVLLFVTLSVDGEEKPPEKEIERLKRVVDDTLRAGDAYTRYKDGHFILMATGAKKQDGVGIFCRIEQAYAARGGKGELRYCAEDAGASELPLPEEFR